jgi:hypothetical protein
MSSASTPLFRRTRGPIVLRCQKTFNDFRVQTESRRRRTLSRNFAQVRARDGNDWGALWVLDEAY